MSNLKIEIDFTQTRQAIDELKEACIKMAKAWEASKSLRELKKLFNEINLGESNNYLKYHKKPMKRRRWLK